MFHGGKSSPGDDPASWDEVYHAPQAGTTWANTHPDYKKHAWKSFSQAELAEKPLRDTLEVGVPDSNTALHCVVGQLGGGQTRLPGCSRVALFPRLGAPQASSALPLS